MNKYLCVVLFAVLVGSICGAPANPPAVKAASAPAASAPAASAPAASAPAGPLAALAEAPGAAPGGSPAGAPAGAAPTGGASPPNKAKSPNPMQTLGNAAKPIEQDLKPAGMMSKGEKMATDVVGDGMGMMGDMGKDFFNFFA